MKSAEEWGGMWLGGPGDKAKVVEAIREEMRQEWVKENRRWCAANNVPLDRSLIERMLEVGKVDERRELLGEAVRAGFNPDNPNHHVISWDKLDESTKESYRKAADAVLAALEAME